MGDTLDESPPSRRDKPQSLSISPEQPEQEKLPNEPVRERDHICSNQTTVTAPPPLRRESLNSNEQQPQAISPGGSFHKALGFNNRPGTATAVGGVSSSRYSSSVVVGGGIGNLAGTTTRKCVLTLDGYSYVIVASTPETLPSKREEGNAGVGPGADSSSGASGAATSSAAGAATSSSSSATAGGGGGGVEPNNGEQNSPTSCELGSNIQCANATINGQVAKHGSLTIVRRSNSRKSFTQIDGQTQSIASPSSSNISFFQTPLSEPLAERLSGRGSNGNSAAGNASTDKYRSGDSAARGGANSAGKMQPSSPNKTNYSTDLTPNDRDYRLTRESSNFRSSVGNEPAGSLNVDQPSDHSIESGSNLSVADAWETETLPAVDTPDALNKAAVRIRSLLRRMDHEAVAYEDMQRNLHYAARVLEAVFIDESRSPTSGKSKMGQIASSSVESEDDAKRCNGNCKNLNNNNSNTNSSCGLHKTATEGQQQQQTTTSSDNQTTSIESRTKGVSLAPQTHSGPTGPPPPEGQEVANKTLESVQEEQTTTGTTTTTTATTTTTTITTDGRSGTSETNQAATGQSVSSSSSCSNKATVQRQRRLRTPVWARSMSTNKTRLADEDDELSEVQPDAVPPEVREWLASTFTRQMATTRNRSDEKPRFRSVAHAIRAGIFVDRIYRRVSSSTLMQFPPDVVKLLKNLDEWTFDVFALTEAASGQVIKYVAYDLLNRYGAMHKFKIAPGVLETFLHRVEEGYCRFRNPYHNNLHAVDVMHTMHYCLCNTGLMNWLTDLEIFASLLAALLHDFEHTGTTNNFHVMSGSETALLYNDRAVLENHHVSASFRLMKDDDANILSHLSREEYKELRTLIIDMVLATDMTYHFQQLKIMRNLLTLQEPTIDKSKALSLVLHCCDISHPAKHWDVHHRWTMLLLEEFFRQGDLEKELGLPFSPLCDRKNTLVAESQIGFIDFIVEPSMSIMSDMLEHILAPIAPVIKSKPPAVTEESTTEADGDDVKKASCPMTRKSIACTTTKFTINKPWLTCLTENKKIWKEQAIKDAEARALVAAAEAAAEAEADENKPAAAAAESETGEQKEAATEAAA